MTDDESSKKGRSRRVEASRMNDDKADDKTAPGEHNPVWPPEPRISPPRTSLIPPGKPQRTLTPFVWLDALLGLPAGFVLFYLVGHVVQALTPDPTIGIQVTQAYASLGIIGAVCAPVCFVIGRRFPILATLTALGVLGMIVGTILVLPMWMAQHGYL